MLRKFQQSLLAAVAVGLILGRLQNVTPAGHKRKTIAGNLDSGLKVYDLFRRYIEHENHLVNQRLTWLLTIHGFLYATCGLVLQKKVEIDRNISSDLFSRVVACQTIEQIKAKGCIGRLDFVQVTDGNNIIFKSLELNVAGNHLDRLDGENIFDVNHDGIVFGVCFSLHFVARPNGADLHIVSAGGDFFHNI